MDDAEINRAVAEVCGWRDVRYSDTYGGWQGYAKEIDSFTTQVPDYCHDLNAMAAAEQMLCATERSFARWCEYWEQLSLVTETGVFDKDIEVDCRSMLHATARQRAEALLRVLGRWRE